MTTMADNGGFRITGKKVLLGMIAFYAVIMAVNGTFMFFALDTFPGLTDKEANKHGVAYNQTLAEGERQKALDWKTAMTAEDGRLRLDLTGPGAKPLVGAVVAAVATRPIGELNETPLTFSPDGVGGYVSTFSPDLKGRWKVDVTILHGADRFRTIHEVMVK